MRGRWSLACISEMSLFVRLENGSRGSPHPDEVNLEMSQQPLTITPQPQEYMDDHNFGNFY